MSTLTRLPKGHLSILSPQFKYVPAAFTDLAATFARIRRDGVQPQRAADASARWRQRAAGVPEVGIDVLEATWPVNHRAGFKEAE